MTISIIILAAGKSSRMNSNVSKVMHLVAERPLLGYILDTCKQIAADKVILVTSPLMKDVRKYAETENPAIIHAIQENQLGTGDAVKSALPFIEKQGKTIILYGDAPFVSLETLENIISSEADLTLVSFTTQNPNQYGRLITAGDKLLRIVENSEASSEEKQISLCNSGIYSIKSVELFNLLPLIKNNNSKQEYFLTDIIKFAVEHNLNCTTFIADESEVLGVNNRKDLSLAESVMQNKIKDKLLDQGVTIISPETSYIAYNFKAGRDVKIYPNVFIGKDVQAQDNVTIHSFSHIEQCVFHSNVSIGPFARIRPGTEIENKAKIGNFVEVKNSRISEATKINHLSYIGDSFIGSNTNIGAGTITCNFDGIKKKSQTHIGNNVSIGSNSCLVAPLVINDGAFVAAGSVITENVDAETLAFGRARQVNLPNRAQDLKK